jgi:glucokinase
MSERWIGVDIGGTRTKLVYFAPPDTVLGRAEVDSRHDTGADLVRAITAAVQPWVEGRDGVTAVGVAVAGLVDRATGRVLRSPNLSTLEGFAIVDALRAAIGARVELDNDANAAGLAEARLGAAAGSDSAVCLTVGTGVGGAIVERGRLWRGHGGMAGEIGRMLIDEAAETYFEEGVGAAAVVSGYLEYGGSAVADLDAAAVARRADAGDEAARRALQRCGERLGVGLAILVNLFNPQVIVIGGGLAGAGEWFLGPARREGERRAWAEAWQQCQVVVARLGTDAGAIGAALLCAPEGD